MIQRGGIGIMAFACLLLFTPGAWAAQQASGIAGAARDTSGAVLPGVTVEAASPALIEKVRTVVTDDQGRYNIVALVPGTYTVTFTLPGFSTVRQEGVVLTAGFTATVNADLAVGALEETITVTGESPLVDTQNVRTQTVISNELLDVLPTGAKSFVTFINLTPGMVATDAARGDVGGSAGPFWGSSNSGTTYHGIGRITQSVDGMPINDLGSGSQTAYLPNLSAAEEMAVETSGFSAESASSGVRMNVIPKSGGNTFTLSASTLFSNGSMQDSNLNDKLRARGVREPERLFHVYNTVVAVGGPIKRDKLWFFTAPKWDGMKITAGPNGFNTTQGTPFYTPDPTRRQYRDEFLRGSPVRLTWQASQNDKVNVFGDYQVFCGCPRSISRDAPEVSYVRTGDARLVLGSWTRPVTNRFLLEAGGSYMGFYIQVPMAHPALGRTEITPNHISIADTLTGIQYNAQRRLGGVTSYGDKVTHRYFQRYSAAYVTGSHAFKAGVQLDQGRRFEENLINQDITYDFRGGSTPGPAIPLSLTLYATPYSTYQTLKADLGLFVQDQWTMRRLTLNLGLRFDYFNTSVPEQHAPVLRYVPVARDFAAVRDVPNWKDLNPRVGAAYDLLGNGRTALKTSLSRYVVPVAASIAQQLNPLVTSVNTVNRDWNDSNGNYIPDCDLLNPAANGECGRFQNLNFGGSRPATRWADDAIKGFGVREGFWAFTTEVQHHLTRGTSLSVAYSRNWNFNSLATDNLAVGPEDYSPFHITAPVDPRLPGGGGYTVRGLYDLAPAKVGQVDNLVRRSSDFGKKTTHTNNFFTVSLNTRFGSDIRVGGGVDTGRTVLDNCFVVDSPQQLYCRVVTSFKNQTQIKAFGSYPLPAGFLVSAIFTSVVGPVILANYTATRTQIEGLGRPLSTSSRSVPLVEPETQIEPRRAQLDLKLTKTIRLGAYRLQPNLGIYNALNGNGIVRRNDNYGPQWIPLEILGGRLFQVSAELSF